MKYSNLLISGLLIICTTTQTMAEPAQPEKDFLKEVNYIRSSQGTQPVEWSLELQSVTDEYAAILVENNCQKIRKKGLILSTLGKATTSVKTCLGRYCFFFPGQSYMQTVVDEAYSLAYRTGHLLYDSKTTEIAISFSKCKNRHTIIIAAVK